MVASPDMSVCIYPSTVDKVGYDMNFIATERTFAKHHAKARVEIKENVFYFTFTPEQDITPRGTTTIPVKR